jgi:hypothetical protein
MLQSKRQNFHHSKMPNIGELVTIPKEICNRLSGVDYKHRKGIIESFPLCDNERPYSIGIHTVNVRMLHNNEVKRFSGFYFVDNN